MNGIELNLPIRLDTAKLLMKFEIIFYLLKRKQSINELCIVCLDSNRQKNVKNYFIKIPMYL